MTPFKTAPVATLISIMTAVWAVLAYVQGTGLVTGAASTWLTVIAGSLNVLLGLYARGNVTPVVDPKDKQGRRLYPASRPPAGSL